MFALEETLSNHIQTECNIKPNQLIPIHELPANIQQKVEQFISQNNDKTTSDLFLIQVAIKSNHGDIMRIYLHTECTENKLAKQRIKLLQNERDHLIEINRKTNKNLHKNRQIIDMLHQYNEIKDVAQKLMGTLNGMKGTTTKELYEAYDLNLTD